MTDLVDELAQVETKALAVHVKCNTTAIRKSIKRLLDVANEAELAHSGSWIGYHASVYYDGLRRPPPGAFFDKQWGLHGRFSSSTVGDWVEYSHADIYDHLKETKTHPSFIELGELTQDVIRELDDVREELLSVVEACRALGADEYLDRMKEDAQKARMVSPERFARSYAPSGTFMTNDHRALAGGTAVVPPHVTFRANVQSIRSLFESAEALAKIAKRTTIYLSRREKAKSMSKSSLPGTRVFIGHGHSVAWLELKNYIQDRLHLECDDFNREATAGHTTVDRLSKMLDDACFAFLVLTAEDERKDGKSVARMNVIHEAGLFQGRLGFEKAIVMLEDGCEGFSNIHGLTHIPFEKGKIKGAFHEVADTLRREGVIS